MANKENNHGVANFTPQQSIVVTNPEGVARRETYANVTPVNFVHGIPQKGIINQAPVGRTPAAQRRATRRVTAFNTTKPTIYRVAIDGRPNNIVFPTPGSKLYYLKCIQTAMGSYPVDVVAYSVINNRAYFLIASYDQTPVSYRRFFDTANELYARYFNNNFQTAGFVFKSKLRVKELKKIADICESVSVIESQPYANFLTHSWAYPFSSYAKIGDDDDGFIACRQGLYRLASQAEVDKLINEGYAKGLRTLPEDFFNFPEIDRFTATIENVLIDYGCYTKRAIPNYLMPKIIAEINERGGFEYDRIASKLALSKRDRYNTLVRVVGELAINMHQSYDESVEALGVKVQDTSLMRDVVIWISDRLGYSVDQIFGMIGMAYCTVSGDGVVYFNDAFLVEIIKYLSYTRNQSVEFIIEKLGIRNSFQDPNRIINVVAMCK
ncbi:MAG: hypothetical protein IJ033_04005 [Clostridia bacterium]|nr:hypothetical protein [Clostridia bacterium]